MKFWLPSPVCNAYYLMVIPCILSIYLKVSINYFFWVYKISSQNRILNHLVLLPVCFCAQASSMYPISHSNILIRSKILKWLLHVEKRIYPGATNSKGPAMVRDWFGEGCPVGNHDAKEGWTQGSVWPREKKSSKS